MLNRFSMYFIGILLIVVGIRIFSSRVFYTLKFGLVNMGPYHSVIGMIFVIVGLFFVYDITKTIIKDKRKGRSPR